MRMRPPGFDVHCASLGYAAAWIVTRCVAGSDGAGGVDSCAAAAHEWAGRPLLATAAVQERLAIRIEAPAKRGASERP